jgi:short-subunit dehydrogenase
VNAPVPPRSVVITGASRGIGRALAEGYAGPGMRLGLVARSAETLADVVQSCEASGATVRTGLLDVRDGPALTAWLDAFEAEGATDLVIANAGVSGGTDAAGHPEAGETAIRQVRINLEGAIATAAPFLEPMRRRGTGQIAFMSSLAAFLPVPDSPGYCASKAGVLTYGLALRALLAPSGVRVSVICPGFVETEMSRRYGGWRPFLVEPGPAAARIRQGLARNERIIAFPGPLAAAVQAARLLPTPLVQALMMRFRFHIAADPAPS